MAREIFISYSRWNLEQVKAIKTEIEQATGAECWMDLNAIESGAAQFTQDIVDGINTCPVFLFMLSKESQDSKFALRELNFAMKKAEKDKQKHVVIVNIDDCEMCDEFDFMYGLTDTIAWGNQPQKEKLLRDVRRWLGKGDEEEQKRKAEEEKRRAPEYNSLGDDYYFGRNGKAQDYAEAVKWYRKAAEQGDARAQFYLSHCYAYGRGVSQDYSEAVKWLRKAAEQGDALAQNNLGWCYDNGQGVPQDESEAMKWFRKAAEQGVTDAQYNLGWCYQNSEGVPKDIAEAVKWYRKAAEQGHERAKERLKELGY